MTSKAAKQIIVLILLLVIIDFSMGFVFPYYLKKINSGLIGKTNQSLRMNSDCLILGSSRAMHHYNPKIINQLTTFSSYNSGTGGYGLLYNYALLKETIKSYKPKIVILDISPNVIDDAMTYQKLKRLTPFAQEDNAFKEIVNLESDQVFIQSVSNLYIYNSTLYDYIWGKVKQQKHNNGFVPLSGFIEKEIEQLLVFEGDGIDLNKSKYFKKTIQLCEDNNIKLMCFVSPTFQKFDQNNFIIDHFRQIANKSHVCFYDYSDDSEFYGNPKLFKDQLHLNYIGAAEYSKQVAKIINTDY